MNIVRFYCLFAFVLLVANSTVIAQTGNINGKVTDEAGKVIAFANITVEGTSLGAAAKANGEYLISNVPAKSYTLQASAIGYRKQTASVDVREGTTSTVNFTLTEDVLLMDVVVVSGTAGGAGVRKKDASFAISTMSASEIRQFSPMSTAHVLELVPGVWSESSGGVAGANIFVRGMPSSGDAPFVTMSIHGAPIYGTQTLSFFEQSSIFRIDETVGATEALRGGPSSVFSNGEPGLTTNFNLRKGTEITAGLVKYTTSDYNEQRIDAVLSGPLSEHFYYMVGGYARTSPGIRNTEFNSDNGRQVTVQLTKVFEKGVLNGFTRLTDDHGQWVLPMSLYSGNEAGTFSPLGNATRFRELRINEKGETKYFDFSNGRGWKGAVSGLNADFELGGDWNVRSNLSFTVGEANTYGFVPNGAAIRVSDLIAQSGVTEVKTVGGKTLSGSEWIQTYGHWVVIKELQSITNDVSLSRKASGHDITVGLYQAFWSSKDFWTLGNHVGVHNVANGDILDTPADSIGAAGGGGSWNYGIQSAGDARVLAAYIADSWQIDPILRVDFGLRYELFAIQYTLDHGAHPDGQIDKALSLEGNDWAATGAINYDLNEELGVFGRFSKGGLFPNFDQLRENNYSVENDKVVPNLFNQAELGVKYQAESFGAFATAFLNNAEVFDGDVGATRASAILKTQTLGVELDGGFTAEAFSLRVVGTFQKGEIKEAPKAPETVGKSIWRQPDWQIRIAPSYTIALGDDFQATIFGAVRAVGKRWNDRDNLFQLDGYTKVDAGIDVSAPGGLSFNLHGDNLTDSDGLTEGDPRDPRAANGRPIFGRSVIFSVVVNF